MSGFYLPSENDFDPSLDDFVLEAASKERRYLHFDLPLSEEQRLQPLSMSTEERPHRFLPLLGYTDVKRKFVRGSDGIRRVKVKNRQIRFAGHADAAYLETYTDHLNNYYEYALNEEGTTDVVLAYRRGGGTNITHAKSLFDEISTKENCHVFAIDISGFFDCLSHIHLRDEIAMLLGTTRLEGHHATVWKNITRYSWVETSEIDEVLGADRNGMGRVCSPKDFVNVIRGRSDGLVQTHSSDFGIPQGTPVSGLYANIYMRSFDREMMNYVNLLCGSYRRYSDDIAIILPRTAKAHHVIPIIEKILAQYDLCISENKTETAEFVNGKLVSGTPIQYLGFTFDGEKILIRPSSLDNYRRKMRRGIHAKMVAAKLKGIPFDKVFKRESLSRYTHLGRRRNFLRYAYRAAEVMDSVEIKEQVRRHVTWFKRAWKSEIQTVFKVRL